MRYGDRSPWGPGMFFQHEEGHPHKRGLKDMKVGQTGYLWGLSSEEPTIVGPQNKYHWRAQPGQAIPYWELFNGPQPIGLHAFPVHEAANWPKLLERMLEGFNS